MVKDKIALHSSNNSFFEEWVKYCLENDILYKVVNCYDNNIVANLFDCKALMWHHNHADPRDVLFARQLLTALEIADVRVFPSHFETWHFDDKLGQKYLFESTSVHHVPTHVFFEKKKAQEWAKNTTYPKVFKLRRGAGSRNVWLVRSEKEALSIIRRAFGRGIRQYDVFGGIKENIRKYNLRQVKFKEIIKALGHVFFPLNLEKSQGREKGYVYFQDFIPNNKFDIRVIVIADRAFAIKRNVRENDFRASGSGYIEYERELFDINLIELSFLNADKLKSRCVSFDYVFSGGKPLLVEISYAFNKKGYVDCPGYWTKDLQWHNGKFNPYGWMISDLILNEI